MREICERLLFLGSFDSEKFWRDEDLSVLPSVQDFSKNAILAVMDEMQFVLCKTDHDILITGTPISNYFKDYLSSCGFNFKFNNEFGVNQGGSKEDNIFKLFQQSNNLVYFKKLISKDCILSPLSVIPAIDKFCTKFGINSVFPNQDIIKKVNSKIYSFNISKNVFCCPFGCIINSSQELFSFGEVLLKEGSSFLIKDLFGVSGKGILPIYSMFILNRICYYLKKQEYEGKKTIFLIEPILNKEFDFSCQINIQINGEIDFISLHANEVEGFKHLNCRYLNSSRIQFLEKEKYFEKIELIGKELYNDKYFGPVCIDSMILKDGSVRVLVEINARKSMTLFHDSVRKKFPFIQDSLMIQLNLMMSNNISLEQFMVLLQKARLLFNTKLCEGILPLSGNSLVVNSNESGLPYKAALFAIILSASYSRTESLLLSLKRMLIGNGISIIF